MRWGAGVGHIKCSPDDGDYDVFLDLMQTWCDQKGVAVSKRDLEDFCRTYATGSHRKNLRSPTEWIRELKKKVYPK